MKGPSLTTLMQRHHNQLKGFPLDEIKQISPSLHAELRQASKAVDFAVFHDDRDALITAISSAEKQYLAALERLIYAGVWKR